ncbi:hypothetical protein SK578_0127 [Streptococcus mitis]|uniref:Uncharacterized protein n=1 Tax=Streptococcus mitis TaxID=28037 RepID=A0A081R0M4_STRMT|nr:hypothetical protein SK578_0127 [Streptococcus mitis]
MLLKIKAIIKIVSKMSNIYCNLDNIAEIIRDFRIEIP